MRKATILLVTAMFLSSVAFAADGPIEQGSMIIGGGASFQSLGGDLYEDGDGDGVTLITFVPQLGLFVAPGILLGGEVIYLGLSQDESTISFLGFGPMIGFYFNMDPSRTEPKGAIYPYFKVSVLYGKVTLDDDFDDDSFTAFTLGGQFGILLMLSNAVAIDGSLRINSDSFKHEDADDSFTGTRIGAHVGVTAFCF